jgi:hypothetical protein
MVLAVPGSSDNPALLTADTLKSHRKWLVFRSTHCIVESGDGDFTCHARVVDNTCRSPLTITEHANGSGDFLRIVRPQGNFRMQTIHEGIPVADEVYDVTDTGNGSRIGVIQKPWLKGVWRDQWILRNSDWEEVCRVTQSSLLRALIRTFLIPPLPASYGAYAGSRCIGRFRGSWEIGRLKMWADLRQDPEKTVDRRLAVALLILLMTH